MRPALSVASVELGVPGVAAGALPARRAGLVAVVGHGRVADAIEGWLADHGRPVSRVADLTRAGPDTGAAVVASDGPAPAMPGAGLTGAVPWLPVGMELQSAVVGPAVLPGIPGCPECAGRRRRDMAAARPGRAIGAEPDASRPLLARERPAGAALHCLAAVAATEAAHLADHGRGLRCANALVYIGLEEPRIELHPLVPDAACPQCRPPQPGTAGPAAPTLRPRRKTDPGSLRVRHLGADALAAVYVDPETGIMPATPVLEDTTLPFVSAPLPCLRATGRATAGAGMTTTYGASRATAIAEGVERLGGGLPDGRREPVRGTYRELYTEALDPRALGLYPRDSYARPRFAFQPFDEDLRLAWVWGYSFARRRPVLVPESFAYWAPRDQSERRLAFECSNGSALGSCVEEAALHGLLEVAERDAFLMTWYARLPAPRVDLRSAGHTVQLLAERIEHRHGYLVEVFCTTLEQGVPAFWAMATEATGDPGKPRALCAAGASMHPGEGVFSALRELAIIVDRSGASYQEHAERIAAMAADGDLVLGMDDHSMCYFHPATFGRFGFLLRPSDAIGVDVLAKDWPGPDPEDLTADLTGLISRYIASGLDVIVVDLTRPEQAAGGFAYVKVLVPGALPMTFGHRNRRVHGLPRLLTVPRQLGYTDHDLRPEDLNTDPHPFL